MSMDQKNNSGFLSISAGNYSGAAAEALRKAQKSESELQKIQRQQAIACIKLGYEQIQNTSDAIQYSAEADAQTAVNDAWTQGAQCVISAAQLGGELYARSTFAKKQAEVTAEQNNLAAFEEAYKNATPASRTAGERGNSPQRSAQVQDRTQKLLDRETALKIEDKELDKEVLSHLKSDAEQRKQMGDTIFEQKKLLTQKENTAATVYQSETARMGLYSSIFSSLTGSIGKGVNQTTARDKGYGDSARALAQYAGQQADAAISTYQQDAASADQQAAALNRVLEAVARNGTGPG